jgi:hypothetical protein
MCAMDGPFSSVAGWAVGGDFVAELAAELAADDGNDVANLCWRGSGGPDMRSRMLMGPAGGFWAPIFLGAFLGVP